MAGQAQDCGPWPNASPRSAAPSRPAQPHRWPGQGHPAADAAMTVRVPIADDHPLVRQGLQAALAPDRGPGRGRGHHRLDRDPRGRALPARCRGHGPPDALTSTASTPPANSPEPSHHGLLTPNHDRRRLGVRGHARRGPRLRPQRRRATGNHPGHHGRGRRRSHLRPRLSVKTVANHLSAIFAKLQVADRTQAILRARDAGLGHP
jgi:hypothetical protein